MTIFIIDSPIYTASHLDSRRLNKQILECQWIINMKEGKTKPSNHPAYLMYKDNIDWVKLYQKCLIEYRNYKKTNDIEVYNNALKYSNQADKIKPDFMCQSLYDNFRKRLFTKNQEYYNIWKCYGTSDTNYYYVDGNWLKYTNGKKEIDKNFNIK